MGSLVATVGADLNSYVWGDNVHKAKTQCERYAHVNLLLFPGV